MEAPADALTLAAPEAPPESTTTVRQPTTTSRLPTSTILIFAAPVLGQGFMFLFTGMYLMKFSTDILGIAPGAMGMIFFVSRLWDAVCDPVAGYLSDRTSSRIGRRRPWILAGALPVGLVFYAMWAPPVGLGSGTALTLWMGAAVVVFYTGMTVFNMPHDSLAAELSDDYEDRNRIFGIRRALFGVGTVFVFAAVAWLSSAEAPRRDAQIFAAVAAVLTTVSMLGTGILIRERPEFQGRGARRPFRAFVEVFQNPHARLLIGVFFLQQVSIGAVTSVAAYYAEYVLMDAQLFAPMMGSVFVVSLFSIPGWIWLGHRFDKKSLILVAMCVVGAAFFSIGFLSEGDDWLLYTVACIAGLAVGGLDVLFPSMQADVIDFDELRSDERKEGVYFAAWAFAAKTALGVSAMLVGFGLSATGYAPGGEQPEAVKLAIRVLMSGIPVVTYGAGILLFRRFALTREAHAEIHTELARRRLAR